MRQGLHLEGVNDDEALGGAPGGTAGWGNFWDDWTVDEAPALKVGVGKGQKDVLELCPRSFDVFLQVGFVVENPKPKQQVEQGLNMDRINEINDWFWNPV